MGICKVKINYPNGKVYEYESDNPYDVYNAICEHGLFNHCKREIVACEDFLKLENARRNDCDMCPVKKYCNVFNTHGRAVYGVMVGIGKEEARMHTAFFEHKEDAEKLMEKYIQVVIEEANRYGNKLKVSNWGIYHFVDVGDTHWHFFVKEVRLYNSFPL